MVLSFDRVGRGETINVLMAYSQILSDRVWLPMILRPSLMLNAAHTTPPPTAVAMATIGTYFFAYFMLSVSFSGLMNRTTGLINYYSLIVLLKPEHSLHEINPAVSRTDLLKASSGDKRSHLSKL